MNFPDFMFRAENMIPASQQNTPDIEGYYYTANDGSQMAFGYTRQIESQKNICMIMMNGCFALKVNI